MLIHIGYEMIFDIPSPCPIMVMLYLHPSRAGDLQQPDRLQLQPDVPVEDFVDNFGNRCARLKAPAGRLRIWNDNVIRDSGQPDLVDTRAIQHEVEDLPPEMLQFLLASRYCEVDLLSDIAWNMFGSTPLGWARVQAVCDWVHQNVTFGYPHARATRTAYEVYHERVGVCRDFQHLAVAFCRCLNIPARYATGFLGDIRVPPPPGAMDFSAWFEVYLGGRWYPFDARFNTPRVGRSLMAVGRDAVDVALTTSFGPANLQQFTVWTDEVKEPVSV